MKNKPFTGITARKLKLIFSYLTLTAFLVLNSINLRADSLSSMPGDSSMLMAQDSANAKKPELSFMEEIASNKVVLYSVAVVAFLLIIGLTLISSLRGNKRKAGDGIGYRKTGGHHHHHKHRMHGHH